MAEKRLQMSFSTATGLCMALDTHMGTSDINKYNVNSHTHGASPIA